MEQRIRCRLLHVGLLILVSPLVFYKLRSLNLIMREGRGGEEGFWDTQWLRDC